MKNALECSIEIALDAHAGQTDKGGAPYILHPLRVMLAMKTDEDRIAAVLHDVLEDTGDRTFSGLAGFGFSPDVLLSVLFLTRQRGDSYDAYIERVAGNPIARRVKLADLADNSDLSRIPNPTAKDYARVEKYARAIARLSQGTPQ